jgi:hypothetical protein
MEHGKDHVVGLGGCGGRCGGLVHGGSLRGGARHRAFGVVQSAGTYGGSEAKLECDPSAQALRCQVYDLGTTMIRVVPTS